MKKCFLLPTKLEKLESKSLALDFEENARAANEKIQSNCFFFFFFFFSFKFFSSFFLFRKVFLFRSNLKKRMRSVVSYSYRGLGVASLSRRMRRTVFLRAAAASPTSPSAAPSSSSSLKLLSDRMLLGRTVTELEDKAIELGEKKFRGKQIYQHLVRGVNTIDDMTSLSKELRGKLKESGYTVGRANVKAANKSKDGTEKLLLELSDGNVVECVGIPVDDANRLDLLSHSFCFDLRPLNSLALFQLLCDKLEIGLRFALVVRSGVR